MAEGLENKLPKPVPKEDSFCPNGRAANCCAGVSAAPPCIIPVCAACSVGPKPPLEPASPESVVGATCPAACVPNCAIVGIVLPPMPVPAPTAVEPIVVPAAVAPRLAPAPPAPAAPAAPAAPKPAPAVAKLPNAPAPPNAPSPASNPFSKLPVTP